MTKPSPLKTKMQMWTVTLAEHDVGRHHVPAGQIVLGSINEAFACLTTIRRLHGDADVPPWRPYVVMSWPFCTARLSTEEEIAADDYGDD